MKKKYEEELREKIARLVKKEDFSLFVIRHGFYGMNNRFFLRTLLGLYDSLSHEDKTLLLKLLVVGEQEVFPETEEFVIEALKSLFWEREVAIKVIQTYPLIDFAKALEDKDWRVRWAVVQALRDFISSLRSEVLEAVVDGLIGRLEDESQDVRRMAAEALKNSIWRFDGETLEKVVNSLVEKWMNGDWAIGYVALEMLRDLNLVLVLKYELLERVVNVLIGKLEDENWRIRQEAIEVVGNSILRLEGKLLERVINALIDRLEDEDWEIRREAVEALKSSIPRLEGELLERVVNALIGRLEDENWGIRWRVVRAFGNLIRKLEGGMLDRVIGGLVGRLEDKKSLVRWEARRVLFENLFQELEDGKLEKAIDRLNREFRNKSYEGHQGAVVRLLESLFLDFESEIAEKAAKEFIKRLKVNGQIVYIEALRMFENFFLTHLDMLVEKFKKRIVHWEEVEVPESTSLKFSGEMSEKVVNKVGGEFESKGQNVSPEIMNTLGNLASGHEDEILKRVVNKLASELWSIRWKAVEALKNLAPKLEGEMLEKVVDRLVELLGDEDGRVRWKAVGMMIDMIEVILKLEGERLECIVGRLIVKLENKDWRVRQAAMKVLMNLIPKLDGKVLKDAVNALIKEDIGALENFGIVPKFSPFFPEKSVSLCFSALHSCYKTVCYSNLSKEEKEDIKKVKKRTLWLSIKRIERFAIKFDLYRGVSLFFEKQQCLQQKV